MTRFELLDKFKRGQLQPITKCSAFAALSKQTACRMAKKVPHIRIGRTIFVDPDQVEKFVLESASIPGDASPKPDVAVPDLNEHTKAQEKLKAIYGSKLN